ncbi:MAG TPA: CDP-alcohol phosphatidyltransferase family protein [Actinomycetota bacterium]|jgi:phosphatidylglycerophosphate synthase|nr:CDP-alcohol phosphatidyltransferase family protein [Actinomycetota bacterium]
MTFEATAEGAKKRDYWWTVLATDPIALPAARVLARRRWLTPDQVTALALVAGLAAGVCFATATREGLIAGGLVFYLAFILDCVDGKLARALSVTSPRGEALDHLADGGRRASAGLGLIVYLWRTEQGVLWGAVYAVLAYFFLEISGAERGPASGGAAGRLSRALARRRLLPTPGMPDVQAIVFILGPLSGYVVAGLGIGIAMVSAAILLTVYRRLR